jgi:membrane protease YdiL (CAAX protease family)
VVVGYLLTTTFALFALSLAADRWPLAAQGPILPALIQAAIGIAVFGGLTWLVGRRALHLSAAELGWAPVREGLVGFGKGLALAAVIGALALALGWPLASRWQLDGGSVGAYLARIPILALVLLPAAFFEELAFRGALFAGLAKGLGRFGALGVSSILFALVHAANPSVTPLALANIALAGVFLGLTFLARGGLWTATGAHLGWNLMLAALAAPVSGLPFDVPWIDFIPGQPAWVTGGGFGPEGGLLASIALVVGAVWVTRWRDFKGAS